jgi:hypothetical protein
LSALQQDVVRKLAAILRIADALDYGHQSKVHNVECKISNSKRKQLSIRLEGPGVFEDEIRCAAEKSTLMNEVFGVDTVFK